MTNTPDRPALTEAQRPRESDVQVFKQPADGVRLQFFRTLESWSRDGEWLRLHFAEGGQISAQIGDLVWAEPERH